MTCSRICSIEWRREYFRVWMRDARASNPEKYRSADRRRDRVRRKRAGACRPRDCAVCGVEFAPHNSSITCSVPCSRERKRIAAADKRQQKKANCIVCGNAIHLRYHSKTCSKSCSLIRNSEMAKSYPRDATDRARRARERALNPSVRARRNKEQNERRRTALAALCVCRELGALEKSELQSRVAKHVSSSIREQCRARYANNSEKYRAQSRAYYKANPEKNIAWRKTYDMNMRVALRACRELGIM